MLSDADAQNASPQNLVMVMPPPMHDECSLAGYVKYRQEVTSAARQSESRLGKLLSPALSLSYICKHIILHIYALRISGVAI